MVLLHVDEIARVCARVSGDLVQMPVANPRAVFSSTLATFGRLQEAQNREPSSATSKPHLGSQPFNTPIPFDTFVADRMAVRERQAGLQSPGRIALAALALFECEAWKRFGYRQLTDYCRERLDRKGRWLEDAAALGRGLRKFRLLECAVTGSDGVPLGRVAATAIARIATPESIEAWIRRGRERTVRELLTEIRAVRAAGRTSPADDEEGSLGAASEGGAERRTLDEPEPEIEETEDVRIRTPPRVFAAFLDVFDLHRALNGYDTKPSSFADSLGAERAAGAWPPRDEDMPPPRTEPGLGDVENACARKTRRWSQLLRADALEFDAASGGNLLWEDFDREASNGANDARLAVFVSRINASLRNLEPFVVNEHVGPTDDSWPAGSSRRQGRNEVRILEQRLFEALRDERARERRLAKILCRMDDCNHWTSLGFASAGHYAVERLGIARRTAESHMGILRALRKYPVLLAAYEDGRIGHEAAWELYRMRKGHGGNPELDARWVRHANQHSVKRLRHENRTLWRRVLDVGEESSPPEPAGDAEWHAGLRRTPGMSLARLRHLRFPGIDAGWSPELRADVCVRMRLPVETARAFLGAVESARRGMAEMTRGSRPVPQYAPGEVPASFRAASYFGRRKEGIPPWVGLLVLLEDYAATHDDPRAFPKREADAIYQRDGHGCMAPGCTARCTVEDHHIVYRSHRGSHEPWNRLCLCRFHHHQGEHGQLAKCRGKAPLDVTWRLGEPELATWWRNERRLSPLETESAA